MSNFLVDASQAIGQTLNAMSDFPNVAGISDRSAEIMTWLLPNGTSVQMYVNPENFVVAESKQIQPIRTKGGYIVQVWGDNLTRLTLAGTTGSSGVKGIGVLRDIYHSENRSFEIIAASQTNQLLNALNNQPLSSTQAGQQMVSFVADQLRNRNFLLRPSLASLALGVTLYFQGVQYRGFFTSMTTTEDINRLGLFQYNIEFMATDVLGKRNNFMAWHKNPIADDVSGQLMNAMVSSIGNSVRGFFGLSPTQNTPTQYSPANAPLSFGSNSLAAAFGLPNGGAGG